MPNVPRGELSEDAILRILDSYQPERVEGADPGEGTTGEPSREGDSVPQYVSSRQTEKICQNCRRKIARETHICLHCHTHIAGLNDFE